MGVVALIVLGPEKLPDAAQKMGRLLKKARHFKQNFEEGVEKVWDAERNPKASASSEKSSDD